MFASSPLSYRPCAWGGLVLAIAAILLLGLSPPFLPSKWGALVMHVFAPVCHQMSVRSPHIGEIQIAFCDRCTGIYLGLVIGVLVVPLLWSWCRCIQRRALSLLLGATGLLGLDWIGPILGTWPNVPISRFVTGGILGVVVGLLAGVGLLRSVSSPEPAGVKNPSSQSTSST